MHSESNSCVVYKFAVPVLLGTSFIGKFVRGIFSPEQKIVVCNSRALPSVTVEAILEYHNAKAKDVTAIERHAPRLVRVERKTMTPPKSKGTPLLATDAKGLVQIDSLLE